MILGGGGDEQKNKLTKHKYQNETVDVKKAQINSLLLALARLIKTKKIFINKHP